MARRQKITAGEINVRLHPHEKSTYPRFMEAIYSLRKAVKVYGDRHAMISLLNRTEESEGIYTGFITTFTKIDFNQPWFDTSTLEEADDNKISEISIPRDLYPNAQAFYFLFNANSHRFFIQTYSKGKVFSINNAARLLEGLAIDLSITKDFNLAKITVVQSKEGLDKVLSLSIIKKITIVIEKPNADIFDDDFDERVEGFLEELHSKRLTITLDAEPGQSIDPNQAVRRVGQSGIQHGRVEVSGRDQAGATTLSTADYPKALHDRYDPETTTEGDAFRSLAGQ